MDHLLLQIAEHGSTAEGYGHEHDKSGSTRNGKWFEFVGCDVSRPQRAPQASVLEAVRFVMEQLRPEICGVDRHECRLP